MSFLPSQKKNPFEIIKIYEPTSLFYLRKKLLIKDNSPKKIFPSHFKCEYEFHRILIKFQSKFLNKEIQSLQNDTKLLLFVIFFWIYLNYLNILLLEVDLCLNWSLHLNVLRISRQFKKVVTNAKLNFKENSL